MDRRTRRILHHDELVMGTVVTFDLYDENEPTDVVLSLLQEAIGVLHEADDVFSTYKDDSPLSRLRRGEMAVEQCPKDVGDVLELCEVARTITDGWFDPWSIPGGVDPTGYVKGWAAQRSLDVLRHGAIHGAIVNAAGDTASFGGPHPGERFRIGIVDPASTQRLACVVESPGAVATSGTYERGCHLIDPRTRRPTSRAMSATVTGTDLGVADALATALAVGGVQVLSLFEAIDGYEGLVIDMDNNFHTSAGFPYVSPRSKASTGGGGRSK